MDQQSIHHDLAREIVLTLVRDGNRAGEGLPLGALRVQLGNPESGEALFSAIQDAVARGWVRASDGMFVTLTDLGYKLGTG